MIKRGRRSQTPEIATHEPQSVTLTTHTRLSYVYMETLIFFHGLNKFHQSCKLMVYFLPWAESGVLSALDRILRPSRSLGLKNVQGLGKTFSEVVQTLFSPYYIMKQISKE